MTLHTAGRLHGCIGTVLARRSLLSDLVRQRPRRRLPDRRFTRLTLAELEDTVIEVSVLSPLSRSRRPRRRRADAPSGCSGPASTASSSSAAAGARRSCPRCGPPCSDPADFLAHLKVKAGFPPDFWSPEVRSEPLHRRPSSTRRAEMADTEHADESCVHDLRAGREANAAYPRPLLACARRRADPVRPVPARVPAARRAARLLLRARRDG